MKKTKIICTLGPRTDDDELMRSLVQKGMDIARFNFSHGTHEEQKARMDRLKRIRDEEGKPIAILLDTKGPEIRTGILKDGKKVALKEGDTFVLTAEEKTPDRTLSKRKNTHADPAELKTGRSAISWTKFSFVQHNLLCKNLR